MFDSVLRETLKKQFSISVAVHANFAKLFIMDIPKNACERLLL